MPKTLPEMLAALPARRQAAVGRRLAELIIEHRARCEREERWALRALVVMLLLAMGLPLAVVVHIGCARLFATVLACG